MQQMASKESKRPRLKDLPCAQVTALIVIVAMALADRLLAVQWLLVKPYRIPSGSMEPTLDARPARARQPHSASAPRDPKVGDIIVFHPPAGADDAGIAPCAAHGRGSAAACASADAGRRSDQTFIKRVVGVGGDRIQITDGHVVPQRQAARPSSFIEPVRRRPGLHLPAHDHGARRAAST